MARGEELTDEQWAVIEPHLPELPRREDGRGRPWRENREVMNGILWILRSGARWQDLPGRFPPYQTCHRVLFQKPLLGYNPFFSTILHPCWLLIHET